MSPQKYWEANNPAQLGKVLDALSGVRDAFNAAAGDKQVSMADMIVLGGCAAVEAAAKSAGHSVSVPFSPGRTDATAEMTDVESFAVLEPQADGFRNYFRGAKANVTAEEVLVDKAQLLGLERPRDDGPVGRHAGHGRQLGWLQARRLHRPSGRVDQ